MGVLDPYVVTQYIMLTFPKRTQQMALGQSHNPCMRSSTHFGQLHYRHPRYWRRHETRRHGRSEIFSRAGMRGSSAYGIGEREYEDHDEGKNETSYCEAQTAIGVSEDESTDS